jgi:hypothetical protein
VPASATGGTDLRVSADVQGQPGRFVLPRSNRTSAWLNLGKPETIRQVYPALSSRHTRYPGIWLTNALIPASIKRCEGRADNVNAFVGSGIVILGLALALNLPPLWLPEQPQWALHFLVMLAVFLLIFGPFLIFIGLNHQWVIVDPTKIVLYCITVFIVLQGFGFFLPLISDEDLEASFQFSQSTETQITISSSVVNNGRHASKLLDMGLFIIWTHYKERDEPVTYLNMCNSVNSQVISTQQFLPEMGGDGQITLFFSPTSMADDEKEWKKGTTVTIVPHSDKYIISQYEITPLDQKRYDKVILCPMLAVSNERGQRRTAICKGIMAAFLPHQLIHDGSNEIFIVLPRQLGETACAATH